MSERRHGDEAAVEASDVSPRGVIAVAGVIVLTIVLATAAIWGLLRWWNAPIGSGPNTPRNFEPAAPRLETAPQEDRAAYVADKEAWLHSYGWVDREAGIAHVPIEAAMEMLAARAASAPPAAHRGVGRR